MSKYKHTLNLPKTNFPIKSSPKKEEELLAKWESEKLYEQIETRGNKDGKPSFVLHDGPPYANGHIHHGHILNKVLKDIVVKYKTMKGFHVPFVPGWDCHGLPIETAVEKEIGNKLEKDKFRDACREYASRFVDIQRGQFKRLGVLGRWDKPYTTMDYSYEAQTLRELAKFADAGLLYKDLRPVYWCPVHRTALAEAEIEHQEHTSPSAYVAFKSKTDDYYFVIWTTTPWTLHTNAAIAVSPEASYGIYETDSDKRFVVAMDRAKDFFSAMGLQWNMVNVSKGKDLAGTKYTNPLNNKTGVVVADDYVKLDTGTGCVHIAPAHGVDDFRIGVKHYLEIKNAIDQNGRMEQDTALAGLKVDEANKATMDNLKFMGALLNNPTDTITHKYPHSWRSHKPVYTRATQQWFVDIDKPFNNGTTLRERAKWWLHQVQWLPEWGYNRIKGMIDTKPDWCLSRQRSWGVPLVSWKCTDCNYIYADAEMMRDVAAKIEVEGTQAWFNKSLSDLGFGWVACHNCDSKNLVKGEDILDVWFDSGVSFACALERETGKSQADLYLEGSDQHRGWFNSSLFCSLVSKGQAPYKKVLTHGFVVDEKGEKLAKSKGNFIDPFKIIEKDGVEVLRLWVAMSEFRDDVKFSNTILDGAKQTYHKIRNTTRYMLSNLYDFNPETDLVPLPDMEAVDVYAVNKFYEVYNDALDNYEDYNFHSVVKAVENVCAVDLSSFYFEVIKDRLYNSPANSLARRSAQSALYRIVERLMKVMAPIMCFTMEEAWSNFNGLNKDSIHLQQLLQASGAENEEHTEAFDRFRELRHRVNIQLEALRNNKEIGSSLEADVNLLLTVPYSEAILNNIAELLSVSRATYSYQEGEQEFIEVLKAKGSQCQRCWKFHHEISGDTCYKCSKTLNV